MPLNAMPGQNAPASKFHGGKARNPDIDDGKGAKETFDWKTGAEEQLARQRAKIPLTPKEQEGEWGTPTREPIKPLGKRMHGEEFKVAKPSRKYNIITGEW